MSLVIELTPMEEARLAAAAQREGVQPAELARKLVTERLPDITASSPAGDPTLALFAEWEREDATMTPEEIVREQALWQQFEEDINAVRQASGMRQL